MTGQNFFSENFKTIFNHSISVNNVNYIFFIIKTTIFYIELGDKLIIFGT